ncbi:MAG: hypothetical protein FIA94_05985 [Nitrospirae bacterium]|nr:hypothetical protein [Nitrospirota bacterium]
MKKADILCDKDSEIMSEFSRLCLKRLDSYLPLKLFLSLFQSFYDENVLKELKKNRMIILHATEAFDHGRSRGEIDVTELFELTKTVDHEFARKVSNPFFSLTIKYDDFADIRKKRIGASVNMVFELLGNWQDDLPYAGNVRGTYEEDVFRGVLGEMLHLYNLETRMLSSSITLHGPAARAKDIFADKLFTIMEKTARDIAAVHTLKVYADNGSSSADRQ